MTPSQAPGHEVAILQEETKSGLSPSVKAILQLYCETARVLCDVALSNVHLPNILVEDEKTHKSVSNPPVIPYQM